MLHEIKEGELLKISRETGGKARIPIDNSFDSPTEEKSTEKSHEDMNETTGIGILHTRTTMSSPSLLSSLDYTSYKDIEGLLKIRL